jgi:DNA repair protein RecO (recombination protein O)
MKQREPAICLRTTDYSETSQVLHFLTRGGGVVRLLGKGTKRPKSKSGGAMDLLSEGDLVFIVSSSGALGTLVEFTETASHSGLRKEAVRLNSALYMIELVGEMLAEGDPHPEVFDLLHNTLERVGQADAPVGTLLGYFQWRLLRYVGLLGELEGCVSCGRPVAGARDVYFCSSLGGLLCRDCEPGATEKYRLDGAALGGLAALGAAEAGKRVNLAEKQARAINRLLGYHITQQLGKPLKMARYAIG